MRILVHDYGGYSFSVQLSRELARCNHQVHYVYSDSTQFVKRGKFQLQPDDPPGLSLFGVKLGRPFSKYSYFKRRAQEIEHGRRVSMEIGRFQPEIVISADTPLDAQVEIINACRGVGGKFVFWLQDLIGIATDKILKRKMPVIGNWIGDYYIHLEKRLLHKSDLIISISEDFLPVLFDWKIPKDKVSVIPNWAPLDEVPVGLKENGWARSHGIADKFCFLFAGILGLKHNPELLLQLAVQTRQDNAVVMVVSEGPGADWLKENAKQQGIGNLLVLDFQPGQHYAEMLASADVLVAILGRDAGGFSIPSKVLSYLCAQRPLLLAIPFDNLAARIVIQNQAGVVVSPDDLPAFISAAKEMMEPSELVNQYGKNARQYAEEHFDIKQITTQFESCLF